MFSKWWMYTMNLATHMDIFHSFLDQLKRRKLYDGNVWNFSVTQTLKRNPSMDEVQNFNWIIIFCLSCCWQIIFSFIWQWSLYWCKFLLHFSLIVVLLRVLSVLSIGCQVNTVFRKCIKIFQFGTIRNKHLSHFFEFVLFKTLKSTKKLSYLFIHCNNSYTRSTWSKYIGLKPTHIIIFGKCTA